MTTGISIHIGLNRVDPDQYNGWDGQLAGCINDATAMQAIADAQGYTSSLLLDDQATAEAVMGAISQAAQSLSSGDHLLLTYSGHGGQVDDCNSDEEDAQDETWVLYDRMLVDDELYQLFGQFAEGVRIFMLSDSCHSGTVARMMLYNQLQNMDGLSKSYRSRSGPIRFRAMPEKVQREVGQRDRSLYRAAQWLAGRSEEQPVSASVILISGCLDNQLSSDGDGNGLFTATLLGVWQDGVFEGSHNSFWRAILDKMPATQSPNYFTVGTADSDFEAMRPFVLEPAATDGTGAGTGGTSDAGTTDTGTGGTAGALPEVHGPGTIMRSDDAPTFTVVTGANPYYIFEITGDPDLFNGDYADRRTTENWYASWEDPEVTALFTDADYQLPEDVWEHLKVNDQLWFRIGTTSADDGTWSDYTVSTGDVEGASAESLQIAGEKARPTSARPPARKAPARKRVTTTKT
jgi:hypothetical protein